MMKSVKTIYLVYFIILAFICKVFCKNKKYKKDLIIKTDRLGDSIIWEKVGFENYITVMRSDSLSSDYPVDIYKMYLNPIYLWKVYKQIYGEYEKIYIFSSSKTSDMFALAYLCDAPIKTTIEDENGNIFFASFFERILMNTILPNTYNEYSNVKLFLEYDQPKIKWEHLKNQTVLFMPFASHDRKEISFEQYKQILKKLDEYQIVTYIIGLVSEERKTIYENELKAYPLISSKINVLKLDEYSQYVGCVYLGMDTSIFHLLYNQNLCNEYHVIMGLGYNFRFIPLGDERIHCIFNHCNHSYCQWECRYNYTKCIKDIHFV
jgi:ADP-heptose:LPS heptosyltransferase